MSEHVIFIFIIPHGNIAKKSGKAKPLTFRDNLIIRKTCFTRQIADDKLGASAVCRASEALRSQIIKKLNIVVSINKDQPALFKKLAQKRKQLAGLGPRVKGVTANV